MCGKYDSQNTDSLETYLHQPHQSLIIKVHYSCSKELWSQYFSIIFKISSEILYIYIYISIIFKISFEIIYIYIYIYIYISMANYLTMWLEDVPLDVPSFVIQTLLTLDYH